MQWSSRYGRCTLANEGHCHLSMLHRASTKFKEKGLTLQIRSEFHLCHMSDPWEIHALGLYFYILDSPQR